MFNKTFALTIRAFRIDARHVFSHLMRFALASVVLLSLLSVQSQVARSAPGRYLFQWILYSNAFFVTIAGPLLFANAITQEKEERTLALLKIANVDALTILFGKALPRLWMLFLILVIQFPFTLLAITLGGVSFAQIGAGYLAIIAYAVMVGCMGLISSVMFKLTANAVGFAGFLLLGYHVGPPLFQGICQLLDMAGVNGINQFASDVTTPIYTTNVFWRLGDIMATGYDEGLWAMQVPVNLGVGVVLFVLAALTFDYFNQHLDPVVTTPRKSLVGAARKRVWDAALVWKDFNYVAGGLKFFIGRFVLYGLLAFAIVMTAAGWHTWRINLSESGPIVAYTMLFGVIPIEATLLSSRFLHTEIHQNTLGTLAMLPRSLQSVAWSKLAGTSLALIPSFCFVVAGFLCSPESIGEFLELLWAGDNIDEFLLVVLGFFGHSLFFWHLVAALSLRMNPWWAIFAAGFMYYVVLILGLMIFGALMGLQDLTGWLMLAMAWGGMIALQFSIGRTLADKAAAS